MFKPNNFVFLVVFLLALTVDISEAKGRGGGRGGSRGSSGRGYRYRGSSGGYYFGGFDFMIFVYVILGILGFCFLLWVLYKCFELAEDDDYQETNTYRTEGNTQPKYELNSTRVDDAKLTAVYSQSLRQENNFNSAAINMPAKPEFNNLPSNFQTNTGVNNHMTPSENQNKRQENNINSVAMDMPAKPEYEALNNFPSNIQTNTYGTNNRMPPSSNLPYSLGEPRGNQNERHENNFNPGFNPAFNPTFNPAAIELPPNPEYEARNNFPSSFQTNTYGSNNHMTSSSNLPYSLTPGEANGNQNGSEPAYAGGWVNQS